MDVVLGVVKCFICVGSWEGEQWKSGVLWSSHSVWMMVGETKINVGFKEGMSWIYIFTTIGNPLRNQCKMSA